MHGLDVASVWDIRLGVDAELQNTRRQETPGTDTCLPHCGANGERASKTVDCCSATRQLWKKASASLVESQLSSLRHVFVSVVPFLFRAYMKSPVRTGFAHLHAEELGIAYHLMNHFLWPQIRRRTQIPGYRPAAKPRAMFLKG